MSLVRSSHRSRFEPPRRIERSNQRGQATIELVLILPFIMLLVLLLLQSATLVRDQTVLDSVTRDAALAAARSDPREVPAEIRTRIPGLLVRVDVAGNRLTVHASRGASVILPLVGPIVGSTRLHSSITVLTE